MFKKKSIFIAIILVIAMCLIVAGCKKNPADNESTIPTSTEGGEVVTSDINIDDTSNPTKDVSSVDTTTSDAEKSTEEEVEEPGSIPNEGTTNTDIPTTVKSEPSTTQKESTTAKTEPSTAKNEPTTQKSEPSTVKQEPTTKRDEPTTKKEEPTTRKNEPTTKKEDEITEESTKSSGNSNNSESNDPYYYMPNQDDIHKELAGFVYNEYGIHCNLDDIEAGRPYFIWNSSGHCEFKTKPGGTPVEIPTVCPYCGKQRIDYDGEHFGCWYGGCSRWMADVNCPDCGVFVKANTCHTCKH